MKAHYETSDRSRDLPARRSADSGEEPSTSSSPRSVTASGPSTRRESSGVLGNLEDRDDMQKWLRDYPETD